MTFKTFLETQIDNKLPIEKAKEDFIFFKDALNLKGKEDIIYNNLFDNIFWILRNKFAKFNCLYKDNEVMYSELTTILYSQIPQFLFLQKKQLLESLDTFSDINNWGSTMKEEVKRDLKLVETTDNSSGYIPIDNNEVDSYSKDKTTRDNNKDETTTDNRNTVDFLYFFSRMKWNTASMEFTTIIKPYYNLFLIFDVRDNDIDYSLGRYDELDERIEQNKKDIETLKWVDENIAKTIDSLENTINQDYIFLDNKIVDLNRDIENIENDINTINENIEDLDKKIEEDVETINKKIDEEIKKINQSLDENVKNINQALDDKASISKDNHFHGTNYFDSTTSFSGNTTINNAIINSGVFSKTIQSSDDKFTIVNKDYVDNTKLKINVTRYDIKNQKFEQGKWISLIQDETTPKIPTALLSVCFIGIRGFVYNNYTFESVYFQGNRCYVLDSQGYNQWDIQLGMMQKPDGTWTLMCACSNTTQYIRGTVDIFWISG